MRDARSTRSRKPRWAACIIAAAFAGLLITPAVYQIRYGISQVDLRRWGETFRTKEIAAAPGLVETDLNQRFIPGQSARMLATKIPFFQTGGMSSNCIPGLHGFLFFDDDVEVPESAGFLKPPVGRGREAADTLGKLSADLQARGIHLLVIPVPAKSSIYPEMLDKHYDVARGPRLNPQHDQWIALLQQKRVDVLDPTDLLWKEKDEGRAYYATDTHWTQPATLDVMKRAADRLRAAVPSLPPAKTYPQQVVRFHRDGDMLKLADRVGEMDVHEARIVLKDAHGPLDPGTDSPVLLLGDSFAAHFNESGAGTSQMLMLALGCDVQSAAIAGASPEGFLKPLADNPTLLANKKAVVLVFTVRHLVSHTWDPVQLAK